MSEPIPGIPVVTEDCPLCSGRGVVARPERRALRRTREAAGLSMGEMGRRLSMPVAEISAIELERTSCPPRVLAAYAALLPGVG
jgi:hypothetical protein